MLKQHLDEVLRPDLFQDHIIVREVEVALHTAMMNYLHEQADLLMQNAVRMEESEMIQRVRRAATLEYQAGRIAQEKRVNYGD